MSFGKHNARRAAPIDLQFCQVGAGVEYSGGFVSRIFSQLISRRAGA
jgi:hypothetical protein